MKHTKTVEREEHHYTCDVCGKRTGITSCIGCRCDVCDDCSAVWYTNPWTGIDNGDYPPRACPVCNGPLLTVAEKVRNINKKRDDEFLKLRKQWLEEAQKNQ